MTSILPARECNYFQNSKFIF